MGPDPPFLPPAEPPEGIDLVIERMEVDDELLRKRPEDRRAERELRSDLANLADDLAEVATPERDHHGRVVVDLRYALVGACVVAVVAGLAFWAVATILASPATP